MLDVARRRGRERGIDNVDHRIVDAERIALPDDAVDAVVCRFGYMVMDDPAAALAETRRVLRAGGRLALAVFGAPGRNPFFRLMGAALVEAGRLPPPDPSGPGPFSMASEERTERLLADAGFADVRLEQVAVTFAVRDVEEYVAVHADTSGPMALVLAALDAGARRALTERLRPALAPFRTAAGCALPGVAVCAVAR
jgi:SAM-dependent methyltransferase